MEKLNDDHSNDYDSVLIIIIRIIIKLDCDPDTDYGVLKSFDHCIEVDDDHHHCLHRHDDDDDDEHDGQSL